MEPQVEMVWRERGMVLASNGYVYPITNLYDCWGDEVTDMSEAISAVAGCGRTWFTIDLRQFKPPVLN